MAVAVRILNLSSLRDARSDKSLVRDAQAGKAEAVTALVQRHYPRVYSFVSYLTSGRGTAEDLTQEVFTRALSALPRFNGQYQFQPWLLKIARNLVIDEARRDVHRASPTDPSDLPDLEPPSAPDHVWESMSQQLAGALVKHALQQMPMRQRTVLVLKEIEGLSYADIAHVIGTNVRGVEATLRRARARFRMEIANAESNESERAICQRTLRLIANEGFGKESVTHLARCKECRSKSSSIRSADKLFGLLPPLALPRDWHLDAAEVVSASPRLSGRSLMQVLRSPQLAMAGPLAQIAEMAAVMVVAGTMTVSSAAGQFSKHANIALAAPPAFETPVIEPSFTGPEHIAPEFAVIDPAPQASEVLASPRQSTEHGGGLEALLTFSLNDFDALNALIASGLNGEQLLSLENHMGLVVDSAQLRQLADSIASSTSEKSSTDVTDLDALPLPTQTPSDPVAATPVSVALPRRRGPTL